MEKLKVGDKVYRLNGWGKNLYVFHFVDTLTKTLAILDSGIRILNKPDIDLVEKVVQFPEYGSPYKYWRILTPEIIEAAEKEMKRQTIHNWMQDKKFTEEENEIIYDLFKELDKL